MRAYILYVVVAGLAAYAWRDWFISLCGLILLTTFAERTDMPAQIAGIPGANPWNFLLVMVVIAWLVSRRREGLVWDMPRTVTLALAVYVLVLSVAWARAALDLNSIPSPLRPDFRGWLTDELLNPLKYMMPGLMLYDGCRTRRRVLTALVTVLLVGIGYALLVIKCMPIDALFSQKNFIQYRPRIGRETGLHACDMATVLAGTLWAVLATLGLWKGLAQRAIALSSAAVVFLGLALCQTRAGYIAAVAIGLVFGAVRWRALLVVVPVAVVVVCIAMPSIPARLGMGFGEVDAGGDAATNWGVALADRDELWKMALDKIKDAPIVGYGRRAMLRVNTTSDIIFHPHNAYFEVLLDTGAIGFMCIIPLFAGVAWTAVRAFRNTADPLVSAVGGVTLASVCSLLICAMSAQSLFPKISMLSTWCFCGILFRVSAATARPRYAPRVGLDSPRIMAQPRRCSRAAP